MLDRHKVCTLLNKIYGESTFIIDEGTLLCFNGDQMDNDYFIEVFMVGSLISRINFNQKNILEMDKRGVKYHAKLSSKDNGTSNEFEGDLLSVCNSVWNTYVKV